MIFVDFDTGIESKKAPNLRQLSGANAMISLKAFPPVSEALLKKHIESGAVLFRIINMDELKEIKVSNLLVNLAKMISMGAHTWQCVLVVEQNNMLPNYEDTLEKIDAWIEHGGTAIPTLGFPASYYLTKREKSFVESADRKGTIIYPAFKPRNEVIVRKDWTTTLATFPYIGDRGAQAIRKMINEQNLGDDLLMALIFLTDENSVDKSDGQWKEIRKRAREWLGLPDGFNLTIEYKNMIKTEIKD